MARSLARCAVGASSAACIAGATACMREPLGICIDSINSISRVSSINSVSSISSISSVIVITYCDYYYY